MVDLRTGLNLKQALQPKPRASEELDNAKKSFTKTDFTHVLGDKNKLAKKDRKSDIDQSIDQSVDKNDWSKDLPISESQPPVAEINSKPSYREENLQSWAEQEITLKKINPSDSPVAVDPLQRRVALQTFINKMKNEFGVNPSKLMEAFTHLSQEELLMAPEQNIEKVVNHLNLKPQERMEAKILFQDMLKQTASNNLGEHLQTNGQELSLKVMTKENVMHEKQRQSVDQMASQFFVDNKMKQLSVEEQLQRQAVQKIQIQNQQTPLSQNQQSQMWTSETAQQQTNDNNSQDGQSQNFMAHSYQFEGVQGEAVAKGEASFQIGASNEADQNADIKNIIQKAQFLARKGGGEMKVQLSSEGMGEISLKVTLDQGQVNVEMLTESNASKKILEKGLGDLKAILASQKLNVDQIKVDISGDLVSQLDQQQEDLEQQQARQFLGDFRHQNQSFKRSFYDVPGISRYKSQTDDEADNNYMRVKSSEYRPDGRRRLSLVA